MIYLVTLSDASMSRSRDLCSSSAFEHGATSVKAWTHEEFKVTDFYRENEAICSQPRGLGYWIWKPYVLLDLMNSMSDGVAVYLDAGVQTINNLNYIIDRMDQDIFLFGNMHEHAHWCKRDIIDAIMPGAPWEIFGKQVQASAIFLRVNDQTRAFVKEWLDWCVFEDGRLIDDSPSQGNHPEFAENRYDQAILTTQAIREGIALHWWPSSYEGGATYPRNANHPDFKENRHDQAVLATMAYRDKVPLHKWPVKYDLGGGNFFEHEQGHYEDDYPVIWLHHRRRNHEWPREVAA